MRADVIAYFPPPDDYEPPTRCIECGEIIFHGPVIGGNVWMHLTWAGHPVVMREEGWWDTATGETRYGNGSDRLVDVYGPLSKLKKRRTKK